MGLQQRERREHLLSRCKFNDYEVGVTSSSIYNSLNTSEYAITPYDEMYKPQCIKMLNSIKRENVDIDLVITGIGGDELYNVHSFKRSIGELPGNIASTALTAAACRSDMFMRRGIWCKNPLLSQSIVDIFRASPDVVKKNRLLHILALARYGLSDGFLFPPYAEQFGYVCEFDAWKYDFENSMSNSVLRDYGVVGIDDLLEQARAATRDRFGSLLATRLFLMIKLERVARHYLR